MIVLVAPRPILLQTGSTVTHDGPHGVMPADGPVFLDFLNAHLKPVRYIM